MRKRLIICADGTRNTEHGVRDVTNVASFIASVRTDGHTSIVTHGRSKSALAVKPSYAGSFVRFTSMARPHVPLVASLVFFSVVTGAACSSSTDVSPTTVDSGSPFSASFLAGDKLVQMSACASCHGVDLSGNIKQDDGVYSANITPDKSTGIGSWTLANLTSALRDGVDDQGEMLCSAMPKFPDLSDADITAIYAYLQGIPPVTNAQTETDCSGHLTGGDGDAGAPDASTHEPNDASSPSDAGSDGAGDGAVNEGDAGDASDTCAHKVCVVGSALAASCGSCAAAVCSHDATCCSTAWSASCVSAVNMDCVTHCN